MFGLVAIEHILTKEKKTPRLATTKSGCFYLLKKNMKETFYFSHDYNAQTDEKILELRMDLGWEWYWIYWALIERLASNKWKLDIDKIKSIAFDMRVDNTVITQLLHNYNLFIIDEDEWIFYNERLLQHFDKRDELKIKKSEAGKKWMANRWAKHNTVITDDNIVITKHNKGKERKVKENKVKENKIDRVATKVAHTLKDLMIVDIDKQKIITEYNSTDEFIKKEMMDFYLYWSEKKPNWKKELWQMQKTFDINRRFNKWLQNSSKWNKQETKNDLTYKTVII